MIKVKLLTPTAITPYRNNPNDTGLDICSDETFLLKAGERKLVSTGISMTTPVGYFPHVSPRSKLANKFGINILGGIGECDYVGEYMVIMLNTGDKDLQVTQGDAIATMITYKISLDNPAVVEELEESVRGAKGIHCDDLRLRKKGE